MLKFHLIYLRKILQTKTVDHILLHSNTLNESQYQLCQIPLPFVHDNIIKPTNHSNVLHFESIDTTDLIIFTLHAIYRSELRILFYTNNK